MNHLNGNSLREMLSGLPSSQLETMLHQELKSETPDDTSVRLLLDLLQEREADLPRCVTPAQEAAWERYQAAVQKKSSSRRIWLRVASILLITTLLLVPLTATASADSFWDLLARWTDSVFQFLDPRKGQPPAQEYVFQTQNPGLQQLYDAVTELGITDPVVPMWLPEGHELVECTLEESPLTQKLYAVFSNGQNAFVYIVDINSTDDRDEYYKDETDVTYFEKYGVKYYILQNLDNWTAVWKIDNAVIQITGDCSEDTLYSILRSIYTLEELN